MQQSKTVDPTVPKLSQNISLLEPYQLDTLLPVFLIPVGQKNQTIQKTQLLTSGLSFGSRYSEGSYSYASFRGLYNNFVLIDYTRDLKDPIFDRKVALTDWAYIQIEDEKLILFKGTDRDTNKDGLLNKDDFQSLFIFNIESLETKEFVFANQTVYDFEPLRLTSKIYVRTGKDLNNDFVFQYQNEPMDLYLYDVATGEKEAMVPEEVKEKIQGILEE